MEVNENNEEIRKRSAILRQKLDLINLSVNAAGNGPTKRAWESQRDVVMNLLKEMDDTLCRTEIVTKFDLMEFD